MDCIEFQKMMEDYENLSDEQKKLLKEHTKGCAECAAFLDEYEQMLETLKSMPKLTAPDNFLSDLNKRIDSECPKRNKFLVHIKRYSYRYSAAAACIALLAVIGVNTKDYIGKMNSSDDGVIESFDVTDRKDLPIVSQKPQQMPDLPKKAESTSSAAPKSEPKQTSNPVTVAPKAPKATAQPTARPTAKAVSKPLATAVPQPNSATLSPTAAPEKDYNTTIYEISTSDAAPTERVSENTVTATEKPLSTQKALNPDEYELPDSDNTNASINTSAQYEHNVNSIEVSYAGVDKVKEIMNEYSISQNGECYNVSTDKLDEFVQAMNDIGVEINENLIESDSDTIMFKIVIS